MKRWNYGPKEWFLFILGAVLLSWQAYAYMAGNFAGSSVDIGVAGFAVLLIWAPKTLVNVIRQARGLPPKE